MQKRDKIFNFLVRKYSLILGMIFVFSLIFSIIFYFKFNSQITNIPEKEEKVELNQKKLEKILNNILKKENDYLQSHQKVYRDIFK